MKTKNNEDLEMTPDMIKEHEAISHIRSVNNIIVRPFLMYAPIMFAINILYAHNKLGAVIATLAYGLIAYVIGSSNDEVAEREFTSKPYERARGRQLLLLNVFGLIGFVNCLAILLSFLSWLGDKSFANLLNEYVLVSISAILYLLLINGERISNSIREQRIVNIEIKTENLLVASSLLLFILYKTSHINEAFKMVSLYLFEGLMIFNFIYFISAPRKRVKRDLVEYSFFLMNRHSINSWRRAKAACYAFLLLGGVAVMIQIGLI